jgi:hypothetical protein
MAISIADMGRGAPRQFTLGPGQTRPLPIAGTKAKPNSINHEQRAAEEKGSEKRSHDYPGTLPFELGCNRLLTYFRKNRSDRPEGKLSDSASAKDQAVPFPDRPVRRNLA